MTYQTDFTVKLTFNFRQKLKTSCLLVINLLIALMLYYKRLYDCCTLKASLLSLLILLLGYYYYYLLLYTDDKRTRQNVLVAVLGNVLWLATLIPITILALFL